MKYLAEGVLSKWIMAAETNNNAYGCDCEINYRFYKWRKNTVFEPSKKGIDVIEQHVVLKDGVEMTSHLESADIHKQYPYLTGEIVTNTVLAKAGDLNNLYALVPSSSADSTMKFKLENIPLTINNESKVFVMRTFRDSIYLQLMPTVYVPGDDRIIPGTPLFDKNSRSVVAFVGNMFSTFDFVVNCIPDEFIEIAIPKIKKYNSDHMRVIVADRRHLRHVDSVSKIKSDLTISNSDESFTNLIKETPNLRPDDDILFSGIINSKLEITDINKGKNKSQLPGVLVTLESKGIKVQYYDGGNIIFNWNMSSPLYSYYVLPRRFYDATGDIKVINSFNKNRKPNTMKKLYKSMEKLF